MGSANQSARTYIGVGPRHCFMFLGTGAASNTNAMTADNLLGGITAAYVGAGKYHIEHGIGNTGYAAMFTAEHATMLSANIAVRGTEGISLEFRDPSGTLTSASFVHGVIHDGGG